MTLDAAMIHAPVDQAEGLRKILGRQSPVVVNLVAGSRRIGTTSSAINLGVALAQSGRGVLLVDENPGPRNVFGLLSLRPRLRLLDLSGGGCTFEQILHPGPSGLMLLAADDPDGSGDHDSAARRMLAAVLEGPGSKLDYVLVDTPAGTTGRLLPVGHAGQEAILVCGTGRDAQAEAYGMLKRLHRETPLSAVQLLVCMAGDARAGMTVFRNIEAVAGRYLGARPRYAGTVVRDTRAHTSSLAGRAAVEMFPRAAASLQWREQAQGLLRRSGLSPATPLRARRPPVEGVAPTGIPALSV